MAGALGEESVLGCSGRQVGLVETVSRNTERPFAGETRATLLRKTCSIVPLCGSQREEAVHGFKTFFVMEES